MTRTTPGARPRVPRAGRRSRSVGVAAVMALAACGPSPAPPPSTPAGDWHEFQGSWVASGTRHTIPFGGDRGASIVDLTGSMLLAGPTRPGVGFRAEALALSDSAIGVIGRAVWTDEHGDRAFSEFRGTGTSTGARIAGTFVGGTGRYAGAEGTYEYTWQYVLETEDGTVEGRAVQLAGRIRAGQSPPTPAAQEVKP